MSETGIVNGEIHNPPVHSGDGWGPRAELMRMIASEYSAGKGLSANNQKVDNSKITKIKGMKHDGEVGGFVLWSKKPDLWSLELVVSGTKISAGSDGKVAGITITKRKACRRPTLVRLRPRFHIRPFILSNQEHFLRNWDF
ncbi:hypothetical protein RND81_11G204800 [Saponaria officinalis]|uniref:Uncharacterized protein n=1 Tax=Saponaria officinalis TaxID=3572 RepID=A0AAW1HPN3_SAPOF